jgi:glyoxylase-like metal-dependent hydrolase (beta-lactamase superfamily II)
MELWTGIHSLGVSRVSNVYLVVGPPPTLIDTGPPGMIWRLLAALKRTGVPGPPARRVIGATIGRLVRPPIVDRALHDGDVLDGLVVLHLPGHTPGHSGLQSGRVLFAGDTVSGGRRLRPAPRFLTWNEDLARRSLARMATLAVDLLLPGHGTPVDDGARRCTELVATT